MSCNYSRDARDASIEREAGIRRKKQLQRAAPDLLAALLAVARVIENTYGHDEETGERIDLPGDYSAADIVEQLCGIERLVSDAIAKATGCES